MSVAQGGIGNALEGEDQVGALKLTQTEVGRTSVPSHCPKVEVHLLRFQWGAFGLLCQIGRPERGKGVWGGEDVIDAEFDVSVGSGACGGRGFSVGDARSVGVWGPARVLLPRGTRGPLTLGAASPAPPAEVAILEEVQQRLAAACERPVVAFALLMAFGPRHLCGERGSACGPGSAPQNRLWRGAAGRQGWPCS